MSFRWKTAAPGATVTGDLLDVVASGTRMYGAQWDGFLKAWDTTGTTANRRRVGGQARRGELHRGVRRSPATGSSCVTTPGTSMPATSRPGPSCGRPRTAPGVPYGDEGPMVVGSTVVVRDSANSVRAYSLATGAPLWGGAAAPVTDVYRPLSSDGTRIFAVGSVPVVRAVSLATGTILWQTPMSAAAERLRPARQHQGPPVVVDGRVYATENGRACWSPTPPPAPSS